MSDYDILMEAQEIIGDTSLQTLDEICTLLFGEGYTAYAYNLAKHLVQVGIEFYHITAALSDNNPSYTGAMIYGNVIKSWGDIKEPETLEFVKIYSELCKQHIDSQASNV